MFYYCLCPHVHISPYRNIHTFLKKSAKPSLQSARFKFRGEEQSRPVTGTHNFTIAHHEPAYLPAVFKLISAMLHMELTCKEGNSSEPLPFFFFQLALSFCGLWAEDSSWPAGHAPRDGDSVTIEEGRTLLLGTTTATLNLLHLKGLQKGGFSAPLPSRRGVSQGHEPPGPCPALETPGRAAASACSWWMPRDGDGEAFNYYVCKRHRLCCLRHNDNMTRKAFYLFIYFLFVSPQLPKALLS